MNPMIAVARPTRADGKPNPPLKWKKPLRLSSGARGVGRKTNVMALKALVWKASKKWARSVSSTLRVQICRKLARLRGRGGGRERATTGLDGTDQGPSVSRSKDAFRSDWERGL